MRRVGDPLRSLGPQSDLPVLLEPVGGLDVTFCLFTTASLGAFWKWRAHEPKSREGLAWRTLGGLALAGAFLTKNVVGVMLPCSAMVVFLLARREW